MLYPFLRFNNGFCNMKLLKQICCYVYNSSILWFVPPFFFFIKENQGCWLKKKVRASLGICGPSKDGSTFWVKSLFAGVCRGDTLLNFLKMPRLHVNSKMSATKNPYLICHKFREKTTSFVIFEHGSWDFSYTKLFRLWYFILIF